MGQIGTLKLQTQNNGTVSVPVYATKDSGSDVYEMVRIRTEQGTGFIPVADPSEASYPYLRIQTKNKGVVAVHDASSIGFSYFESFEDSDTLSTWTNQGSSSKWGNQTQFSTDGSQGVYGEGSSSTSIKLYASSYEANLQYFSLQVDMQYVARYDYNGVDLVMTDSSGSNRIIFGVRQRDSNRFIRVERTVQRSRKLTTRGHHLQVAPTE